MIVSLHLDLGWHAMLNNAFNFTYLGFLRVSSQLTFVQGGCFFSCSRIVWAVLHLNSGFGLFGRKTN